MGVNSYVKRVLSFFWRDRNDNRHAVCGIAVLFGVVLCRVDGRLDSAVIHRHIPVFIRCCRFGLAGGRSVRLGFVGTRYNRGAAAGGTIVTAGRTAAGRRTSPAAGTARVSAAVAVPFKYRFDSHIRGGHGKAVITDCHAAGNDLPFLEVIAAVRCGVQGDFCSFLR